MSGPVRLHIVPLTSELLPKLLAPSVLSQATDISFHTVQTFPESSYGYVNLPAMEAQKLKKKLDGTKFKGKTLKVEEARPKSEHTPEDDEAQPDTKSKAHGKKRKRDTGSIAGYELESDRKVKRGWTEPGEPQKVRSKSEKLKKTKKRSEKSEYTDKEELLFKAKVPENKKDGVSKEKSKKSRTQDDTTIIHEFKHRTKHASFLRSSGTKAADKSTASKITKARSPVKSDSSGSSSSEKDEDNSSSASDSEASNEDTVPKRRISGKSIASIDVPTIDEESGSASDAHVKVTAAPEDETSSSGSSSGASSSDEDSHSDLEKEVDQGNGEVEANPHPLETLFKKPTTKANPAANLSINPTPFSFFSNDNDDNDDIEDSGEKDKNDEQSTPRSGSSLSASKRAPRPLSLAIPATPHTVMDRQWRSQRSAAPTPDTAAPDRTKFKEWFWENRGDNNRAWKKRRREAKKEERSRKNKSKG